MLRFFVLLLALYLPFQLALNPAENIDLASVRILIPLLFLLWIIIGLKRKSWVIPFNLQTFLISLFILINILSLFFAENLIWGLRKLTFLLSIFPLYFILSSNSLLSLNFKEKIAKFLFLGAIFSALIGLFQFMAQFFLGIDTLFSLWSAIIKPFLGESFSQAVISNPSWLVNIGGKTFFRSTSLFPDPHMFSYYLNIAFFLGISLYLTKKRTLYLFFSLLILLVTFLTFSRGGYLGFCIGLIFFIFFILKTFSFKQRFLTFLLFFSFCLLLVLPNPLTNRFYSSFNIHESSNSGRIEIWKDSLQIIKENPILGVGLGNYPLAITKTASYRDPIYAHNIYLDIAAETGILGTFSWFSLIFIAIINLLKKFKENFDFIYVGSAAGLISFSIHSLFETPLYSVHILPLILILISFYNPQNDN